MSLKVALLHERFLKNLDATRKQAREVILVVFFLFSNVERPLDQNLGNSAPLRKEKLKLLPHCRVHQASQVSLDDWSHPLASLRMLALAQPAKLALLNSCISLTLLCDSLTG